MLPSLCILLFNLNPALSRTTSNNSENLSRLLKKRGPLAIAKPLRQFVSANKGAKRLSYALVPLLDAVSEHYENQRDYKSAIWYQKEASLIEKRYTSTAKQSDRSHHLADLYLKANQFDLFMLVMEEMLIELVGPGSPVDGSFIYGRMLQECKKRGLVDKQVALLEERYKWRKRTQRQENHNKRQFEAEQQAILALEFVKLGKRARAERAIDRVEKLSAVLLPLICSEPYLFKTYSLAFEYYKYTGDLRKAQIAKERLWQLEEKRPLFETYQNKGKNIGMKLAFPGYRDIPSFCVHRNCLFIIVPSYRVDGHRGCTVCAYSLATHTFLWRDSLDNWTLGCGRLAASGDFLAILLPDELRVYNIKTGKPIWRKTLAVTCGCLHIAGNRVFTSYHRQRNYMRPAADVLCCHDLATGEFLWHRKVTGACLPEPCVTNDKLYAIFGGRTLRAFELKSCKPLWHLNGKFTAPPLLNRGKLFTMSLDPVGKNVFEQPTIVDGKTGKVDFKSKSLAFYASHISSEVIFKKTLTSARDAHTEQIVVRDKILKELHEAVNALPREAKSKECYKHFQRCFGSFKSRGASYFLRSLRSLYGGNGVPSNREKLRKVTSSINEPDGRGDILIEAACALLRAIPGEHNKLRKAIVELRNNDKIIQAIYSMNRLKPICSRETSQNSLALLSSNGGGFNVLDNQKCFYDARSIYNSTRLHLTRPVVTADGLIYVTNNTIRHMSHDLQRLFWQKMVTVRGNPIRPLTQPAIANGVVFIGSSDGQFLAFNSHSGQQLFKVELNEPITKRPFIDEKTDRAVVISDVGTVFHLDLPSIHKN